MSAGTEALLIALHVMAAYCSNPLRSGVDFHTNEVIDAMDVLALRALERVSGPPPDAYDPKPNRVIDPEEEKNA